MDTYNITTPHILTTYKIYIHATNTSAMAVELLLSPRFCPKKVQSGSFFFSGAVAVQSLGLKRSGWWQSRPPGHLRSRSHAQLVVKVSQVGRVPSCCCRRAFFILSCVVAASASSKSSSPGVKALWRVVARKEVVECGVSRDLPAAKVDTFCDKGSWRVVEGQRVMREILE